MSPRVIRHGARFLAARSFARLPQFLVRLGKCVSEFRLVWPVSPAVLSEGEVHVQVFDSTNGAPVVRQCKTLPETISDRGLCRAKIVSSIKSRRRTTRWTWQPGRKREAAMQTERKCEAPFTEFIFYIYLFIVHQMIFGGHNKTRFVAPRPFAEFR